jgi:hypothetical protein
MPDAFLASFAGFGLGPRPPHYQQFLRADVPVDFVEVTSENFMVKGGATPEHSLGGSRTTPYSHSRRLDVDRLGRRHQAQLPPSLKGARRLRPATVGVRPSLLDWHRWVRFTRLPSAALHRGCDEDWAACRVNLLAFQLSMRDHILFRAGIRAKIIGDPSPTLAVLYQRHRTRLLDRLRDIFERVRVWLGDIAFEDAAPLKVRTRRRSQQYRVGVCRLPWSRGIRYQSVLIASQGTSTCSARISIRATRCQRR